MLYCKSQELCGKLYRSLVVRASGAALIAARMAAAHCSGENRLIAALMSAGTVIFFAARYAVERVVLSQPCFGSFQSKEENRHIAALGSGHSHLIAALIAVERVVLLQRGESCCCGAYGRGQGRLKLRCRCCGFGFVVSFDIAILRLPSLFRLSILRRR